MYTWQPPSPSLPLSSLCIDLYFNYHFLSIAIFTHNYILLQLCSHVRHHLSDTAHVSPHSHCGWLHQGKSVLMHSPSLQPPPPSSLLLFATVCVFLIQVYRTCIATTNQLLTSLLSCFHPNVLFYNFSQSRDLKGYAPARLSAQLSYIFLVVNLVRSG